MPRSRGSEGAQQQQQQQQQRQSPRAPLHLRTTVCSESNAIVRPPGDHRSPKLDDRRSPRGPVHERKRGSRVADLETKLTQAQAELKKLKEQLASTEAAKRDAQHELEAAKKLIPAAENEEEEEEENEEEQAKKLIPQEEETTQPPIHQEEEEADPPPLPITEESSISSSPATDVFEVVPPASIPAEPFSPIEGNAFEDNAGKAEDEPEMEDEKEEVETKTVIEQEGESKLADQTQLPISPEAIAELTAKLSEKEKEVEALMAENGSLKKQAEEAANNAEAARVKEEGLGARLVGLEEELRESRANAERLGLRLEAAEGAKGALEAEMKRLRVQTEQWRKAAEAAAAVLASGDGPGAMEGNWRCGSMEKHSNGFGGYEIGSGSPMMGGEDGEEGLAGGGGKRRGGGGIRMFGELWKKRGQHHRL